MEKGLGLHTLVAAVVSQHVFRALNVPSTLQGSLHRGDSNLRFNQRNQQREGSGDEAGVQGKEYVPESAQLFIKLGQLAKSYLGEGVP